MLLEMRQFLLIALETQNSSHFEYCYDKKELVVIPILSFFVGTAFAVHRINFFIHNLSLNLFPPWYFDLVYALGGVKLPSYFISDGKQLKLGTDTKYLN